MRGWIMVGHGSCGRCECPRCDDVRRARSTARSDIVVHDHVVELGRLRRAARARASSRSSISPSLSVARSRSRRSSSSSGAVDEDRHRARHAVAARRARPRSRARAAAILPVGRDAVDLGAQRPVAVARDEVDVLEEVAGARRAARTPRRRGTSTRARPPRPARRSRVVAETASSRSGSRRAAPGSASPCRPPRAR